MELETLDFDLRTLLNDFAVLLATRAHETGLEFICAAAPDVPGICRGTPDAFGRYCSTLPETR